MGAKIKDVPVLLAQDPKVTSGAIEGVALARDQLDQGGFTAAVRAEDRNVLARADNEIQAVKSQTRAPLHGDIFEF